MPQVGLSFAILVCYGTQYSCRMPGRNDQSHGQKCRRLTPNLLLLNSAQMLSVHVGLCLAREQGRTLIVDWRASTLSRHSV